MQQETPVNTREAEKRAQELADASFAMIVADVVKDEKKKKNI